MSVKVPHASSKAGGCVAGSLVVISGRGLWSWSPVVVSALWSLVVVSGRDLLSWSLVAVSGLWSSSLVLVSDLWSVEYS